MKTCPHCGGARYRRNFITGGLMTCPTCDGTGEVEEKSLTNEEWFCQLSKAEKAEFLTDFYQHNARKDAICILLEGKPELIQKAMLASWLREKHTEL